MSTTHSHGIPSSKNEQALLFALSLTSLFLVIEFISGLLLNSLALIADAAHMLTDATALAIGLAAVRIARRPADYRRTYGYYRFEILSAAFNALLLFGVAIYILYETYQRLLSPEQVKSTGMIIVAMIGLVVNLISMRLLSQGKDQNLNMKGAYLEVWSDMIGSLGVILGAVIIKFFGWNWIDPIVAICISLWIIPRTWILLKESLNILLEGAPAGIEYDDVIQSIKNLPGVLSIHDLHIWVLTSGKNILTAHVVYDENIKPELLIQDINHMLASKFNVYHTTLQTETLLCDYAKNECLSQNINEER